MTDREELVKLANTIEAYGFECEGGSLANCKPWTELKRSLALSDSGVKVKPLEWSKAPNGCFGKGAGYTYIAFSHRRICVDLDGYGFIAWCDTYEEAQAAAQSDYEARIRSALVEVPAVKGEPEPVAWRYRFNGKWHVSDTKAFARVGSDVTPLYTAPPADAGMREALAGLRDWIDSFFDRKKLKAAERELMERADDALTVPGATTKSDGGERDR